MYGGNNVLKDLKGAWNGSGGNSMLNRLILINVFVFLFVSVLRVFLTLGGESGVYRALMSWLRLPAYGPQLVTRVWTFLSYCFLHEGFFHVLFNMLFLFWFGRLIADFIGDRRVLHLYLLGAVVAGLFFVFMYNNIPYYRPHVEHVTLQGASGGVYAVVVGAATLVPNYVFHLLLIGPVRIKYIAIFCLALSFFRIIGPNAGGELAHLGGGLLGFLYIRQLKKGNDWGKVINRLMNLFSATSKTAPKRKSRLQKVKKTPRTRTQPFPKRN